MELSTPETSLRSVVWVVVLAVLAVISGIRNPVDYPVDYIQILGGECGGKGRQIVRCRDISGGSRRKYLHRSGKPLLKRWRTYFGLRSVGLQPLAIRDGSTVKISASQGRLTINSKAVGGEDAETTPAKTPTVVNFPKGA